MKNTETQLKSCQNSWPEQLHSWNINACEIDPIPEVYLLGGWRCFGYIQDGTRKI